MLPSSLLSIINLFLIPVISLYIYIKRSRKEIHFSFENLCKYCVLVAVNSVLNKAVTVIITMLSGKTVLVTSSYYTLIGIVTAVCIPFVIEIAIKYFSIRIEEKDNEEEK